MSAERLREAAALMRERAKAASAGPWTAFRARATNPLDYAPVIGVTRDLAVNYDTDLFATQECKAEDAEHIASWHPTVALAVADWLDFVALGRESLDGLAAALKKPVPAPCSDLFRDTEANALAVATAYLGDRP